MMEHIKWIVQTVVALAAFVTAVTVIAKPIRAILNAQKQNQEQQKKRDEGIATRLDTLERHQRETWMETLRHKIFSSSLPLTERVNAGEIYINNGGNGTAKVQHEENVRRLREDRERAMKK